MKMTPSLRKACRACTKAKRRCIPQLPSCERCAKKHILCEYDLEPVTSIEQFHLVTNAQNRESSDNIVPAANCANSFPPLSIIYNSVSSAREASAAAIANGQSAISEAARPMLMAEPEFEAWFMDYFARVARDGPERKKSPFIHWRIIQRDLIQPPNCVSQASHISGAQYIAQRSSRTQIQDLLAEIQDLMISALQRLLLEKAPHKQDLELDKLVERMFSSTHSLWYSAPQRLHEFLDEWEIWLVAESIRRAMFSAIFIRGIWYAAANGHIFYEPFFESIPFDPRTGLWEAKTKQEWQELIRWHGGEHTKLKSFHEFVETMPPRLNQLEDGDFQRLLFACFHGNKGLQEIQAMEEISNQTTIEKQTDLCKVGTIDNTK